MIASQHHAACDAWLTRTVRIEAMTPEYEGVFTCRLVEIDGEGPGQYQFLPGQFNMLYVPGVGESAISVSGDSARIDAWIHTIRVAGNVTRCLSNLASGETLGLRGPFGAAWPLESLAGRDVLIVAGGLGLAPLRPLIYHVHSHRQMYRNVWLIMGARTAETLLFQNEFDTWKQGGIDVQVTVDRATRGWTGNIGVVTTLIDRLNLADSVNVQMLTCGPEVMMRYAALAAIRRGVAEDRIWISMERNMQCATGLCGHCQFGPSFVCKDGPVYRYDRLRPYLFVESL